jgi:alkanesulfonate monooxygenase SsuD/methylene tetrahydromethanopterin reductase-like flavin-dependent oxidoreductase (luciferase family)
VAGSSIESFPLFGYDLADYEQLFEEKATPFAELLPARFAPYSELYQRALEKFGRPPLPVLVHSPGHVAATGEQAKAEFWPRWRDIFTPMAAERGFALPTEGSFEREAGRRGALYVGSPETVARKIATNVQALGATRFDLKRCLPGLTHAQLMTSIELYGNQVVPRVRELLTASS